MKKKKKHIHTSIEQDTGSFITNSKTFEEKVFKKKIKP